MQWQQFLQSLQTISGQPLALVGYIAIAAVWLVSIFRQGRLKTLGRMVQFVPETERHALIEKELSVKPRAGLSATQWLEHRRRDQLLTAFIATLVVLLLIFAIAMYRTVAPPKSPAATLDLRVAPTAVSGGGIVTRRITATIENVGPTIADDVAVQLETPDGVTITDEWQDAVVPVGALQSRISVDVSWDLRIDTFVVDELVVRLSARNSDPQQTSIPVEGTLALPLATVELEYEAEQIERISPKEMALLRSARREVVVLDEFGDERWAIGLPSECSQPSILRYDPFRDVLWTGCAGSSRLEATPLNGEPAPPIPSLPLIRDDFGTAYSTVPFSIAPTPNFIACTTTDGEQCMWVLDWARDTPQPAGEWRLVTYDDELHWNDARVAWTEHGGKLLFMHENVMPSSLSIHPTDLSGDVPRTLGGHDFAHIGAMTAFAPLAKQRAFIQDEYGEFLSIVDYDGRRLRRLPLTPEEDWSDGTRKSTLLAIDATEEFVAAVVTAQVGSTGDLVTHIYVADIGGFDRATLLAVWDRIDSIDAVIVSGQVIVLCSSNSTDGEPTFELRFVPIASADSLSN